MHERRFNREIERLRDPERVARLEVERVVNLSLAGLEGVRNVLDVGTGTGLFAGQFAALGLQVTGLDANPEMLAAAQQFVPQGIFQEGLAERLPFPDKSFALVFMGLVLHETDDILAALQEAHRVAGLRLAVLEWPDEEQPFGPPPAHRLSPAKIEQLGRQAGFGVVRHFRLDMLSLYLLNS